MDESQMIEYNIYVGLQCRESTGSSVVSGQRRMMATRIEKLIVDH